MRFLNRNHKIPWYFNIKIRIFLFYSCLYVPLPAISQPPVAFKNYTVTHGLSHDVVRDILQDSMGFIWVATQDGLCRFDGYTFKVYKSVYQDSTSLSSNKVIALEEDKNQNIWVATWGGGISVYDRKLDQFRRFRRNAGDTEGLSSNYIYDLFKDTKGRIWVGTSGRGLDRIDVDQFKFTNYRHFIDSTNTISHNRVTSITEDKNGKLWIGTSGGGINHFDPETETFTSYKNQEDDKTSLSDNDIYSIYYDSQHRLWVGTRNNGLNLMEEKSGKFIHFKYHRNKPNSISNNQIWDIAETESGIWIGTDNGLSLFNEINRSFYVYKNSQFVPKSLSANSIKSLYTDHQNRLWIGTYNGGLNLFDKRLVQMHHYYFTPQKNSLSYNDVAAFLQLDKNKVLIATDGGGLNVFNRTTTNFSHYNFEPDNPNSMANNKPISMLRDKKGQIWIGYWEGGLDLFDQKKQKFIHYNKNLGSPKGPISNNITCLTQDKDGFIWIGTYGGGVNKFDPEAETFEYFKHDIDDPKSLSDRDIWAILADSQNKVWVGTSDGVLHLFNRNNQNFIRFNIKEPGESDYSILVIFEDTKGNIWLGLDGGGLKKLHLESKTFVTFTTADGLPSNNINAIEEDLQGNLWLATNKGITRFDTETLTFKNYPHSTGLQGHYFNRQSSAHLSTGELMFGGPDGFNIFHPDSLKYQNLSVPIVFTNFTIFNQPVAINNPKSPLFKSITVTDSITLSYKESVFSIEYAGLNYTDPENMKYKYRLNGFVDESWQEVGNERKVTYTNLESKKYIFEVTTMDRGSYEEEKSYRSLVITVTPPWWQTWWARLLAIVLLSASLFITYRLRLHRMHIRTKRLELEVEDRTAGLKRANEAFRKMNSIIQEQKEEIQAQAEELHVSNEEVRSINMKLEEVVEMRTKDLKKSNKELDNFVYRVSHDIRAPLSSVLGLVNLMEMENDTNKLKQYLKMATQSINKLDGFVKDILDYSRNSRMEVECKAIDFNKLVGNTMGELKYIKNADRIKIIPDIKLKRTYYNDPNRLNIIFRNLFSNAIKYQNLYNTDPFLKIEIRSEKNGIIIIVSDNGVGIAAKESSKVFEMFYRGSDLSNGSGIGLYIVKETVEKLNGYIKLETKLGKGTSFIIELPDARFLKTKQISASLQ